ncbi:MAG: hypothetical protein AB7S26_34810 [Sandaracinaceae bacterium]
MYRTPPTSTIEQLWAARLDSHGGVAHAHELVHTLSRTLRLADVPTLLPAVAARRLRSRAFDTAQLAALADTALAAIERVLSEAGSRGVMSLDARLRAWRRANAAWMVPWTDTRAVDVDVVAAGPHAITALALLSGHHDGYLREEAVSRLGAASNTGLPWLLVRCFDWVDSVRYRAVRAVHDRLRPESFDDIVSVLPLVRRLRGVSRVDQTKLLEWIEAFLIQHPDALLSTALGHADAHVGRDAVELLTRRGALPLAQIPRLLDARDPWIRLRGAQQVRAEPRAEMAALRERLCVDRSGRVRAVGLQRSVEANDPTLRARLETALDDRYRWARELARYHLRERFGARDYAAYYRDRIGTAPTPSLVAALSEVGGPEEWEALVPMLDERPGIARAAIRAMKILDARGSRETRLMMVDDPRPSVSREAARSMRGWVWASDEAAIAGLLASPHEHVRRHARELTT